MPIYRFHPVFIFFCAIITLSCRNPYFEPLFKVPLDTVKSDIQKIVKTQDINIEGHNTPLDDKHVTSLGIQLINAQNINVPPDSLTNIQRQVASKIKDRLKNPLQYQVYWLIFIKRDSVREIQYSHHEFKATEL